MIISIAQKQSWLEVFDSVMALYATFKDNPNVLRVRQAEYRQDEVAPEPLDFVIDVEIKAKRELNSSSAYRAFLSMANSEQYRELPVTMKVVLGRVWNDYSLGVDGAYRRLYYITKQDNMRGALKGATNGATQS